MGAFLAVPSLFRDPVVLTFVDEDNRALRRITNPSVIPRVGENVRLGGVPYQVQRVGYDVPEDAVEQIWIVCAPA